MRVALVASLLVLLAGCATIRVTTDWNPDSAPAMRAWSTYRWLPQPTGSDVLIYNDTTHGHLQDAVDRYLAGRGYTRVADDAPADFAVGWHGSVDGNLSFTTVNNYYSYGYAGWYGSRYGPYEAAVAGVPDTTVTRYDVGTLILDIVDVQANELTWRGLAKAELMNYQSADKRQHRLDRAVAKILDGFPPAK